MKTRVIACAVLTTALSTSATAAAPKYAEPPTRAGVLQAEQHWLDALVAGDVTELDRRLGEEFVDISWRGALRPKAAMIEALRAGQVSNNSVTELTVAVFGQTAVARGLNTIRDPSGRLTARLRFTDVFVYRDGRWVAVSAQETLVPSAG
jgi:hypothetical protein